MGTLTVELRTQGNDLPSISPSSYNGLKAASNADRLVDNDACVSSTVNVGS